MRDMSLLLLITNRKSHTVFRLVPTSVTLNDLERRNPLFCFISPNSIALQAYYVTVVEDRPILSAECRLQLLAITDPPCSAVSLR